MLSKTKIKLIKSLDSKKNRNEAGLFVAEGNKLVAEIIESQFQIQYIACTSQWFDQNKKYIYNRCKEIEMISDSELNKISYLKTPQNVLCIAEIPHYTLNPELLMGKLSLILDNVQDPGNMGTILRIADW